MANATKQTPTKPRKRMGTLLGEPPGKGPGRGKTSIAIDVLSNEEIRQSRMAAWKVEVRECSQPDCKRPVWRDGRWCSVHKVRAFRRMEGHDEQGW